MIKHIFKKIKNWFTKDFSLKKTLISSGVFLLSFLLVIPAGSLSSMTIDEVCADYYAKISKEYTVEKGDKKLSGLIVEPKDGTSEKIRHDTDNAITELWGVFKGENASFAPVMNANREHELYFSEKEYSENNLSFVYTNVGQSTESYHVNKSTQEVIDYKFQSSPIALMFSSSLSGMQDKLHIYISQAQAERKLKAEGKEITKENLKSLQSRPTTILIDGKEVECIIDNIYLDNLSHVVEQPHNPRTNEKYNYYYATDIGTIIGEFVFVIFYAYKQPSDFIKKQSLYVMSEYSYRNKFYLQYAKKNYSAEDFSFDFVRSNLKEGFDPDDNILQNTLKVSKYDSYCAILTVLSILNFLFGIFLVYHYKLFKQPLSLGTAFFVSLMPYFICKIIFCITNNTFVFSSYSLTFNMILFVVFALVNFALNCFGRKVKTEAKND